MGKIITVAIHKGGTGKTTIVSHLALSVCQKKLSVLVVDMDAQGNISAFFNVDSANSGSSDLFLKDKTPQIQHIEKSGLDLLPADNGLFGIERIAFSETQTFRKNLKKVAEKYDLVVIDTPPTVGFAMLAPLIASDFVISPVIPDAYSIRGIRSLFAKIKAVKSKQNPSLNFLGLIINRWNKRNSQQCAMVKKFQVSLKGNVIEQPLGDRSAIANAAYESKAVWEQAKSGAARIAAKEMQNVMQEIMKKIGI